MLAGIAPPQIRRETLAMAERSRQSDDHKHPLHQHSSPVARLKSRRNFMQSTQPLTAYKIATKDAKFGPRLGYLENPQLTPVPNGEMQEQPPEVGICGRGNM
ncbi:hypothetical protein JTB14_033560 [Gonioctena quinquepunctata]|nr:hypothetical protein JTB14_033560 [Gonioctena quinquepunctata]